jgi:hypothetical protein
MLSFLFFHLVLVYILLWPILLDRTDYFKKIIKNCCFGFFLRYNLAWVFRCPPTLSLNYLSLAWFKVSLIIPWNHSHINEVHFPSSTLGLSVWVSLIPKWDCVLKSCVLSARKSRRHRESSLNARWWASDLQSKNGSCKGEHENSHRKLTQDQAFSSGMLKRCGLSWTIIADLEETNIVLPLHPPLGQREKPWLQSTGHRTSSALILCVQRLKSSWVQANFMEGVENGGVAI